MRFKITFILIFSIICLKCLGQNADSIETDLGQSYGRVIGAFMSSTLDVARQFPDEYKLFVKKLVHYTSAYPSTISYPFKRLRQHQMTILTSDDSLFRIYSWHSRDMSDYLFPCGDVWQYKSNAKTISKYDTLNKAGLYCLQLFTLHDHGKTYYLCVYVNQISSEI
jgi:hypothetical protein